MKQLILVRHAQTHVQPDVPSEQWEITENGRYQTHQLAHQLKAYYPTAIISSPLPRAQQTAHALNHILELPIQKHDDLREQDRQGSPFLGVAEFRQKISDLLTHPTELHYGTETGQEARQRFTQAIQSIHSDIKHPLFVSHGTVMTLFISYHNPTIDPIQFWRDMTQPAAFVLSYPEFKVQEQFLV